MVSVPPLAAERRQRLFEAIKAAPAAKTVKPDDLLIVDVAEARKQLKARILDLDEAKDAIDRFKSVLGGESIFNGTRIPVWMITAMLRQGAPTSEIFSTGILI